MIYLQMFDSYDGHELIISKDPRTRVEMLA